MLFLVKSLKNVFIFNKMYKCTNVQMYKIDLYQEIKRINFI